MGDDTKRATYGDGSIRTRKDGLLEKRISLPSESRPCAESTATRYRPL